MIIIVDANIIISALINPYSEITKLLLSEFKSVDLLIPKYALEETINHKNKLLKEFNVSEKFFEAFLKTLNDVGLIYSQELINENDFEKAKELVENIDPKDAIYVAFSLALDALIWTGDLKLYKGLRRKSFTNIISSKELKQIIKGIY